MAFDLKDEKPSCRFEKGVRREDMTSSLQGRCVDHDVDTGKGRLFSKIE
jgi:hypothetical protein